MTAASTTSSKTASADRATTSEVLTDHLAMGVIYALTLTIIQRGLGFLRGVLFCKLMTDQQLGQFSMIYSCLMTLAPFAVLGLPGTFGRFVGEYRQRGQLGSFLKTISQVCCLTTSLLVISILIWPKFFSYQILGGTEQTGLMYAAAFTLALVTFHNYLTSLIESLQQIRLATIMRFVAGVSFTVMGVAMLWLLDPSQATFWAVIAFAASCLLGSIPAWLFLKQHRVALQNVGDTNFPRDLWWRLAPFAAWWWLNNILHNLYEITDRYMLIHWSNATLDEVQSMVGQYHSGRVIPLLMVGVASMLSGLLLPYVASAYIKGQVYKAREQLNWSIKLMSLAMLLVNAALLVFAKFMFDVLLEGRYDDGLAVLPLTMVYCAWFSLMTISQDFLWVSERGKFANVAMAIGIVSNILFNAFLIPQFGLWGAVMATTIGNGLAIFALFLLNVRFQCAPDLGCWLALMLPLVLLLPPSYCLLATGLISACILVTPWFFNHRDKQQLVEFMHERIWKKVFRHG